MRETDLVTMRVDLTGWFDTGSTNANIAVARYHYVPDNTVNQRLSERHEIMGYNGEIFMTDEAENMLGRHISKALDHFATAMLLP